MKYFKNNFVLSFARVEVRTCSGMVRLNVPLKATKYVGQVRVSKRADLPAKRSYK